MKKFILHIETSGMPSTIAIGSRDGVVQEWELSTDTSNASSLLPLIDDAFSQHHLMQDQILAVSVSAGPGSYTGLRIGTSTAKALCYAWDVPLIALPTLLIMANGMLNFIESENDVLIPMIDFRRMEIIFAVFDTQLNLIKPQTNIILTEKSFDEFSEHKLIMGGNGSHKAKTLNNFQNVKFVDNHVPKASDAIKLAFELYDSRKFADLAYFEPDYGKEYLAKKSTIKGLY